MPVRERAPTSVFLEKLVYAGPVEWTGPAIQKARDDLGLTQKQLADRLGVTINTVSSWETGGATPRKAGVRAKLSDVLGSPPSGTPSRLDIKGMPLAELTALLAVVAGEVANRLAKRDDEEIVHPRDDPGTTFAQYDASAYANRANQRRTGS